MHCFVQFTLRGIDRSKNTTDILNRSAQFLRPCPEIRTDSRKIERIIFIFFRNFPKLVIIFHDHAIQKRKDGIAFIGKSLYTLKDFIGKFIDLSNLFSGNITEILDFFRYNRKSFSGFSCPRCFYGCI